MGHLPSSMDVRSNIIAGSPYMRACILRAPHPPPHTHTHSFWTSCLLSCLYYRRTPLTSIVRIVDNYGFQPFLAFTLHNLHRLLKVYFRATLLSCCLSFSPSLSFQFSSTQYQCKHITGFCWCPSFNPISIFWQHVLCRTFISLAAYYIGHMPKDHIRP